MASRSYARFALLLFLLSTTHPAQADSPVWRVSKGENVLYLGGTIHVLTPADYPLPASFSLAYQQAKKLVLETDFNRLMAPETQQRLLRKARYPQGKTLKSFLSPETLQRLETYLNQRELFADKLLRFKPGMLAMVLSSLELQRLGLSGTGVDEFYALQADHDGIVQDKLETIEEQQDFILNLGIGSEDAFIAYTLRDLERLPSLMKTMKASWRQGDVQQLDALILTPVQREYPQIITQLLSNRNNTWLPKIEAMLDDPEVEMVLVGTLHLVGKEGLLSKLNTKGYKIERL